MRAGRKNLRHLAFGQLTGARFFRLIADGDFATAFQNARDVIIRRVMRQATHGNTVARGEREVEQLRAGLRVLEKHLVKIAEAEKQQRVFGQLAFDAAILRHHGRELNFGRHCGGKIKPECVRRRNVS